MISVAATLIIGGLAMVVGAVVGFWVGCLLAAGRLGEDHYETVEVQE